MSDPQRLALGDIDRRFAALRLPAPQELRRLRASVEREGIREPVLVSGAVAADCWVLLDGFKRLRVAEELELPCVWAQALQLDAAQARAAILHCNQARPGLSEIEEAWIVRSLCREQGLRQAQAGELLGRDKSWVCRRLKLAEALDPTLQDDLRLGLLSATQARELAQLPRGNQPRAAQAVRDHQLTSRQTMSLVERLGRTTDPLIVRELLTDPLRYLTPETASASAGECDPRLSEGANRLRRVLLSWEGFCGHLTRSLHRYAPAGLEAPEAPVLAPLLEQALRSGHRAIEAIEIGSRVHGAGGAAHA